MNNKFWNSPAWSMGHRSSSISYIKSGNNKKIALTNPGPGNYNLAGHAASKGGKYNAFNNTDLAHPIEISKIEEVSQDLESKL